MTTPQSLDESHPPRWVEGLLRWFLAPRDRETITGDLLVAVPRWGHARATVWYLGQGVSLMRHSNLAIESARVLARDRDCPDLRGGGFPWRVANGPGSNGNPGRHGDERDRIADHDRRPRPRLNAIVRPPTCEWPWTGFWSEWWSSNAYVADALHRSGDGRCHVRRRSRRASSS